MVIPRCWLGGVEASGADSAPEARDRILGSLNIFGFTGTASVEYTTYLGGVRRYDVRVP